MAKKPNDGGAAFARPFSRLSEEEWSDDQTGMSLLDYLAAAVAGRACDWPHGKEKEWAARCYAVAAALLAERARLGAPPAPDPELGGIVAIEPE